MKQDAEREAQEEAKRLAERAQADATDDAREHQRLRGSKLAARQRPRLCACHDGIDLLLVFDDAGIAHIEMVRSLPADPIIVRQNWLQAYDFTTTSGSQALNDYARANDPFARVGKQQIAVDVSSVIRASPDSFRVAWVERRYQDGALASTERWSAIITITVQPPLDADTLRKIPLGLYVNGLAWSRELDTGTNPEGRTP